MDPGSMQEHATALAPFEAVYREHASRIYRFCLSQLADSTEAEDVAAEVFLSAYAAYERARPDSHGVATWLMTIARNAVIDNRRRRQRWSVLQARFLSIRSEADRAADVEAVVVVREELRRVIKATARLRERDRLLIGLRVAAELSYAEIGAVAGISEHAATVATRRAMERLRRMCEGGV